MEIAEILAPDRVLCDVSTSSKKRALEKISELIAGADSSLTPTEIFDCLLSRERLGSTCIGSGVALPHCRIKQGEKTLGAFMRMQEGVDFDAIDRQPVDLLFALLVPEESTDEHLEVLAHLAEKFSDKSFREELRATSSCEQVFELITRAPSVTD